MAHPITVTVGPLASAAADKVGLSQKAAVVGTNYLVLNGAAGSFSANSICLSQTPSGAGALTLNGALATTNPAAGAGGTAAAGAAVAYLPAPARIYITSAADETAKTFTVVGTRQTSATFGPGVVVSEVIAGPNASVASSVNLYSTIISITSSAATTGAITVGHYLPATLDMARRVIITSGGNDTGVTFTLTGTDWAGNVRSEAITGASAGAASSVLDYLTITSIATSGAVATTVTVGTNGVAGSPWVRFDDLAANAQTSIAAVVSGTVNYDVEMSMDDPNRTESPTAEASMTWIDSLDAAVVAATATKFSFFAYPPLYARVILNSGSGSVTATFRQTYLS